MRGKYARYDTNYLLHKEERPLWAFFFVEDKVRTDKSRGWSRFSENSYRMRKE